MLLSRGPALIGERSEDLALDLRREPQRVCGPPELLGQGLRDLPLRLQRLPACRAIGQVALRGGLRSRGESPIQEFIEPMLETAAVHRFAFSSVPQALKRFSSPGIRRCISAMA